MLTYNVLNEYVERLKKQDMPVVATTDNLTTLTTDDINKLRAGDIVLKEDASGKHAYVVSYKKDGTGICLTYTDATYIETISYDYNSTTHEWTYNSMDATEVQPKLTAGDNISINNNVISATAATYTAGENVTITDGVISATDTTYTAGTGINITDGVISASNSISLYQHNIYIDDSNTSYYCKANASLVIVNNSPTALTYNDIVNYIKNNANNKMPASVSLTPTSTSDQWQFVGTASYLYCDNTNNLRAYAMVYSVDTTSSTQLYEQTAYTISYANSNTRTLLDSVVQII